MCVSTKESAPVYSFPQFPREKAFKAYDDPEINKHFHKGKHSPGPCYMTDFEPKFKYKEHNSFSIGNEKKLPPGLSYDHYRRVDTDFEPQEANLNRKGQPKRTRFGLNQRVFVLIKVCNRVSDCDSWPPLRVCWKVECILVINRLKKLPNIRLDIGGTFKEPLLLCPAKALRSSLDQEPTFRRDCPPPANRKVLKNTRSPKGPNSKSSIQGLTKIRLLTPSRIYLFIQVGWLAGSKQKEKRSTLFNWEKQPVYLSGLFYGLNAEAASQSKNQHASILIHQIISNNYKLIGNKINISLIKYLN